jgi:hypothetical protein
MSCANRTIGLFVPKPSPYLVTCGSGHLTLAQPSTSVHRCTLVAAGIVTRLVTQPHRGLSRARPEPRFYILPPKMLWPA